MLEELGESVEDAAKGAEFIVEGVARGFAVMALPVLFIGIAVALSGLLLRAPAARIGRVV
tara:strand:- start:520 stop:699 length:180 start_codon:yes stop_codon:yes gene_type:complete